MKNTFCGFSLLLLCAMVFFDCSKTRIDDDKTEPEQVVKIDSVYLIEHFDDMVVSDNNVLRSISILRSLDVHFEKIGTINRSGRTEIQGCSIYDGFLFQCYHSNEFIDLISLDDFKRKATILLEPETIVHCNDVSFGGRKYNESDQFPVLYIQQRSNASAVNAYRIISNQDSYDASLIQTISFTPCKSSVSAVDAKNNLFYVLYNAGEGVLLASYEVPSFNKESVTINPSKDGKKKPYLMPAMKVTQDMVFYNHYLIISTGYSGEGELWFVDVTTGVARKIDLVAEGLRLEPEGLSVYQGKLYLVFNSFACYCMDIAPLS